MSKRFTIAWPALAVLALLAVVVGLGFHGSGRRGQVVRGPQLAGVVRDQGMGPLADAELRLLWIGADAEPRLVGHGRSDAQGRYVLAAAPVTGDGVWILMASAPEYEVAGRRIDVKVRTQDFVLLRGAGRVIVEARDPAGAPASAADVTLSIEPAAGEPGALVVLTATTGADGRAVFTQVTGGVAMLHFGVRARGLGRAFGSRRKLAGETDALITAQLVPGAVLSGLVVSPDHKPVATELVLVFAEAEGPWGEQAMARGPFAVTDVPAGVALTLRVVADDYLLADGQDQMSFAIPDGARTHELEVVVQPAGMLSGQVRAASGEAIPGATVEATPSDRRMAGRRLATSDADGRFRIGGLRIDTSWELEVRHPDFAPGFVVGVQASRGGGDTAVRLAEGGGLTGSVRFGATPAGDVEVYAHRIEHRGPSTDGLREHATIRTDADGAYVFEHLNPGTYRVEIRPAARMDWSPTAAKVLEAMVEERRTLTLESAVLQRPGAFRAQVTVERDSAAGQTLEVSIMQAGAGGAPHRLIAQTGVGGQALVQGLEPGRYDVVGRIAAAGYARVRGVEVRADETASVQLSFVAGLALEGRIRRPDGTAAARAEIDVYLASGGGQAGFSLPGRAPDNFSGNRATADENGRFRLAGLEPGAFDLRVTLDGEAPFEKRIEVRPNMPALAVDLVPAASCEVELLDADAHPLESRIVLAQTRSPQRHSVSAVTDAGGRVRFERLPPGRYQFRAVVEGEPQGEAIVEAGQTAHAILKARPSSSR